MKLKHIDKNKSLPKSIDLAGMTIGRLELLKVMILLTTSTLNPISRMHNKNQFWRKKRIKE